MKGGLKRMGNASQALEEAKTVFLALLTIGLIGLLFLIIYGNLSGNLGFAANTLGANQTNVVITNLTGGAVDFFSFSSVWFILLAITVLIGIVIGVIALVERVGKGGGKFSN